MVRCVLFQPDEFAAKEEARRAAVRAWQAANTDTFTNDGKMPWPDDLRALSAGFFPPGSMWFCPWYFDPFAEDAEAERERKMARVVANPGGHHHLSIHYWRDHAPFRPPLEIVCPDGIHWCPDSKSSNGDGWKVEGEPPLLIVTPSIWTRMPHGWHGFLGSNGAPPGVFVSC